MFNNTFSNVNLTQTFNDDTAPNENLAFLMNLMDKCYKETDVKHSSFKNDTQDPNGPKCPRTFDGYSCWDETPASTVAQQNCPEFVVGFDPNRQAYKRCMDDGTWFKMDPEAKTSWSNYTNCVDVEDLKFRNTVNNIYVYGYIVSVIALVLSIMVFIYYRSLRCSRVRVHIHLFTAFALNNILWIIWYLTVVKNAKIVQNNEIWCQVLHVATHYFMVTSYLWMCLEALHLHIALVVVFVKDHLTLRWFAAFGWGVSVIIIAIYAGVRFFVFQDTKRCWMDSSDSRYLIIAPVGTSLCISLSILVNVVRVLLTKVDPMENQDSTVGVQKATRAVCLLIPLFGLHFILIPFRPMHNTPSDKPYQVFSALITSLQGLCVAILFCFTNHEIRAATKTHLVRAFQSNNNNDGIPMAERGEIRGRNNTNNIV